MRKTLVLVAVLTVLLLAGCAQKAMTSSSAAATPAAGADQAVNAVGNDVKDLDSLNTDLDTSDLNSLDQELSDVDSLDIK
jgi:uncharacterized lipoprotein YajG